MRRADHQSSGRTASWDRRTCPASVKVIESHFPYRFQIDRSRMPAARGGPDEAVATSPTGVRFGWMPRGAKLDAGSVIRRCCAWRGSETIPAPSSGSRTSMFSSRNTPGIARHVRDMAGPEDVEVG